MANVVELWIVKILILNLDSQSVMGKGPLPDRPHCPALQSERYACDTFTAGSSPFFSLLGVPQRASSFARELFELIPAVTLKESKADRPSKSMPIWKNLR